MRLIALNRLSIPSIGRDFSPLSLPFDPCPSFSRSNDHVLRNTWLFHVRLQREPRLQMLTENCYNSPVLCFHVTVYVITRFEYAPNEKFSYDDRKSEPFETEEKYDKNISNYRITPLVERKGSSIRVTSISPFCLSTNSSLALHSGRFAWITNRWTNRGGEKSTRKFETYVTRVWKRGF